jgi:serine/threonine protein kinase
MEYIDGSSLEKIRANNPEMISLDFLYDIAIQLSDALGSVWRKHGMIHGDIKPGNLMVCSPGRTLKIGDFGGAKSGDDYDPENVMITPMYVAPEIIRRQNTKPDPRSDIYSFGAMLYELACGTAPFNGTMEEILQAHLDTAPQPLIVMNPDLNRDFAAFIDSMLAKNPDDRQADWDEVKGSLQLLREGKPLKKKEAAAKNPAAPRHASWSAEKKYQRKKKFLEKFPWLIPTLLILVILAALATIPFTMGFFK